MSDPIAPAAAELMALRAVCDVAESMATYTPHNDSDETWERLQAEFWEALNVVRALETSCPHDGPNMCEVCAVGDVDAARPAPAAAPREARSTEVLEAADRLENEVAIYEGDHDQFSADIGAVCRFVRAAAPRVDGEGALYAAWRAAVRAREAARVRVPYEHDDWRTQFRASRDAEEAESIAYRAMRFVAAREASREGEGNRD